MTEPEMALSELALQLRAEESPLLAHLRELTPDTGDTSNSGSSPAGLGQLVAAGPRAVSSPGEYALVVEAIREGYLLHYGKPRLFIGNDPDLDLLAGDYLYALGLDRLAKLGDAPAVTILGDLISEAALCHSEGLERCAASLWLAMVTAVGCGETPGISAARESLRALEGASEQQLWHAAESAAKSSGIEPALLFAAKAIDFPTVN